MILLQLDIASRALKSILYFQGAASLSPASPPPWIATSGLMSEALAGDFEFIDTGAVKADDFRVLTRAHAGLGLVNPNGEYSFTCQYFLDLFDLIDARM